MIRLFSLDMSSMSDEDFHDCLEVISEDRRNKAMRIKNAHKAAVSAGAGMLLDYAFDQVGVKDRAIIKNSSQKPYLKSGEVYFNLSHSGDIAVCVVSDTEAGVDTEMVKTADMRIARRFFAEDEYRFIEENEDRDKAFFRIWTLKESFVKAVGRGLAVFPDFCIHISGDTVSVENNVNDRKYGFFEYEEDGYLIAVCYEIIMD